MRRRSVGRENGNAVITEDFGSSAVKRAAYPNNADVQKMLEIPSISLFAEVTW